MRIHTHQIGSAAIAALALLVSTASLSAHADDDAAALLTVAEKSDYQATARHTEVVELLDCLAASGNAAGRQRCTRLSLGRSGEGRDIPLLILGDPAPKDAAEACRQLAAGDKLLVLAIGNIHAGEVDGKEALPIVARELLAAPDHPILKKLIFAIAPIYNCDGNEQVSKTNRPGQVGPQEGMGRRENAAGLDLNRDFVKLDAPETRALVRFFNEWDPHVFIDTHTTNGSYHRYVITWEGPKNPSNDATLLRFVRDDMLPTIARALEKSRAVPSFVYGDFNAPHDAWETYPAQARFGTTYVGLRNRISVLSEGYSYAPYKTRVLGTRDFVSAILTHVAERASEIRKMVAAADDRTVQLGRRPAGENTICLESQAVAAPRKAVARGFVESRGDDGKIVTGEPKDYQVELRTHFNPLRSAPRPTAYFLKHDMIDVVRKLQQHGIRVERVTRDTETAWPIVRIESVKHAERPFQNHRLATLRVAKPTAGPLRTLPAGTFVVRTAQPLGTLSAYLLEPECDDGLIAWNFLDEHIEPGGELPITPIHEILDDLPTTKCEPLGD